MINLVIFDQNRRYMLRSLPISDVTCSQCDFNCKNTPNNDILCKENSGKHCNPDTLKGIQSVYKKF